MICPACKNQLSVKTVAGIELDVCDNGCGGIWFDRFELKKVDEKSEPDVETLLNLNINPKVKPDTKSQHPCPKCQSVIMVRRFASVKRQVLVDECPKCAGVWLDAGELHQIREEFPSEKERIQAAEAIFDQTFKGAHESHEGAKVIGQALRFICPSYYVKK